MLRNSPSWNLKVLHLSSRSPKEESLSAGGSCSTWWNCGWNTDEKIFLPRHHRPAALVIAGSLQVSNWTRPFPKWPSCCTWTRHSRPFILRQPTLTCSTVSSGHLPLVAAGARVQHTSGFQHLLLLSPWNRAVPLSAQKMNFGLFWTSFKNLQNKLPPCMNQWLWLTLQHCWCGATVANLLTINCQ